MTSNRTTLPGQPGRRGKAKGFTLLEMMVVVGLIAVMASMALPSVIALFNAGADAQAYNLISAQLTAARARAIVNNTYAGIHVQMADANGSGDPRLDPEYTGLLHPDLKHVSFTAQIVYKPELIENGQRCFVVVPGTVPRRIPGSMGYGYVSQGITGVNSLGQTCMLDPTIGESDMSPFSTAPGGAAGNIQKFTTFSIVFNPLGEVTQFVNGDPIHFSQDANQNPIFYDNPSPTSKQVWRLNNVNYVQDRYGATALTIFDMAAYENALLTRRAAQYLDENAQLLPLNVHTGLLYERK